MYDGNFLIHQFSKSSEETRDKLFAKLGPDTKITYGELFDGAETYAAVLADLGVKAGDRVAVQLDKSIDVLKLYLGTIMAGGIFLPLNTAYTAAEIEYFLGDAQPQVFVCTPKRESELTPVAHTCGIPHVGTVDQAGKGTLAEAAAKASTGFAVVQRKSDDLAAILYTSGTTGRSKGAMLTHGNLWSNASTLKDCWHFSAEDILIHALPIFHTHGLFVATNVTLAAGSALNFMTKFDAEAVMAAMSEATVLMGVPTFYVRLLDHPTLSAESTRNMRLFVSGSAPLLAETHDMWRQKTGHAILERYGMTETNMNTSNPYDGERRAGTVGFPLPGVDVMITDPETGAEVPRGTVGALEVRGPNVFQGYWNMPEKTKEELRDTGFFITGDLGMIDDQGYVSIIGRSKDLIITGGYNVYPKELELLIDDIDGVDESAVIGLPHSDFGEAVTAVVVLKAGAAVTEAQIMAGLSTQVARYKQPKSVIFVDMLPRNTMGKVQKNILRQTHEHSDRT